MILIYSKADLNVRRIIGFYSNVEKEQIDSLVYQLSEDEDVLKLYDFETIKKVWAYWNRKKEIRLVKENGEVVFNVELLVIEIPSSELRERAYECMTTKEDGTALITWEGSAITMDRANKVYLEYSAENSPRAAEIQALIIPAKVYIRELYPDE